MSIRIKGGRVLDPATKTDEIRDIFIDDDGLICAPKKTKEKDPEPMEVIDAEGCFVMPGLIDLHEHLRDPGQEYKEDIMTGTAAAARGGFTTILCMPNTVPVVDNPDVVNYIKHKAETCGIHVLPVGAITKGMDGKELADIEGMVEAGAVAISEDGRTVMNSALYKQAMKRAKALDIPVLAHCEDENLSAGGVVNEDEKAAELGLPGISNSAEDVITIRDLMLARDTGVRLHLCHVSTKDAVWLVDTAKKWKVKVSAEVTPHHFTLTSDDIVEGNTNFKMNPPLRTKEDQKALLKGLKNGIIDCIATDHAPHSFDEKNDTFKRAPFGVVGNETAATLCYTELVQGGILTPLEMAEKMSYAPAKILKRKAGTLAVGAPADICIFDPRPTWTIDRNKLYSKSHNTPFHGREVQGWVICTICDGKVVYRKGIRL